MTILEAIKSISEQIDGYTFQYDEIKMMNVKADNQVFPCIYFEEYRDGSIRTKFFYTETTRVMLYFMKLCPMHNEGIDREKIREEIKAEAIKPFIQAYNAAVNVFVPITNWKFYTPPPRFDANEVAIILEFDAELIGQC